LLGEVLQVRLEGPGVGGGFRSQFNVQLDEAGELESP
jgi:hypothetical protein